MVVITVFTEGSIPKKMLESQARPISFYLTRFFAVTLFLCAIIRYFKSGQNFPLVYRLLLVFEISDCGLLTEQAETSSNMSTLPIFGNGLSVSVRSDEESNVYIYIFIDTNMIVFFFFFLEDESRSGSTVQQSDVIVGQSVCVTRNLSVSHPSTERSVGAAAQETVAVSFASRSRQ